MLEVGIIIRIILIIVITCFSIFQYQTRKMYKKYSKLLEQQNRILKDLFKGSN